MFMLLKLDVKVYLLIKILVISVLIL